jgi:ribonuclease HI
MRKGWFGPNICYLCHLDLETTEHLFINCQFTKQVWLKIALALNLHTTWEGTKIEDCFTSWTQNERTHIHLLPLICWTVWLVRNSTIFENMTPSTNTTTSKAIGHYYSWMDTHGNKTTQHRSKQIPELEVITTGWFDGATSANRFQSGAGGLIKISQNTYYKWTYNCGPGTNTRAKLLGAWATLYLASRLHIDTLQVLGDSRIIIEWLSSRGDLQVVSLLAWKDRIRHLQSTFKKLSYIHIHREHNNSVDQLSKAALQKPVGVISYNLWIEGHEPPPSFYPCSKISLILHP